MFEVYPMDEKGKKRLQFGEWAKVLVDMHLENPKQYPKDFILEQLLNKYENLEFDLED
ncbi:hypothetical protein [Bacillus sp. ISL-46]|uniref:hypothetical protein n=1 Tax=Bacillus sp. ISL-46 TaxID=2819129 RepID=UPI001BE84FD2|nr:hypothetical protein [Bacillus sp. ISL-46]MBT2723066.1 hypothetical protein [Bacillus sp. ISL-46]